MDRSFFPAKPDRDPKPRETGITHVMDRLAGPIDPDWVGVLAPYIDLVKIGWCLPLLLPSETLRRRIALYHKAGIEVSTGGTLLEHAVMGGREEAAISEAKALGFDIVEVSEGVIDLSMERIGELSERIQSRGMDVLIEVGKKDVQHQYSLKETIELVSQARKLHPRQVILESRESGLGVGIYDDQGAIKWDWVHAIVASQPIGEMLFEAPRESQQIGLIVELGTGVNLGNVALESVGPLATQRKGLRGDTFGLAGRHEPPKGSPATKFIYYLIENHRGLDQGELVTLSHLPRRTVQASLTDLKKQGRVKESISFRDARRREYRCG